jgi:putative ABC transport system permease protein
MFIAGNGPIEPEVEKAIKDVDGVSSVSALRFGFSKLTTTDTKKDENVNVMMIDPKTYFEHSSFFWKDGDDTAAKDALLKGGSVFVTAGFANRLGIERGEKVTLKTSQGPKTFSVGGIFQDGPGPPRIAMGLPDAKEYLNAGKPMGFAANLAEGADAEAVKKAIENGPAEEFGLDVDTVADNKEEARSQVAQYFRIVYAILAIAAIVGLLGLANTLAMSVLRRFREIGILRAIGVTRSQMWRMVLIESLTLGFVAFVLSIPLGLLLTGIIVDSIGTSFGFEMKVSYPWSWIPIVALFGLVITVIAAIAPGRRAARLHVVSALQYE